MPFMHRSFLRVAVIFESHSIDFESQTAMRYRINSSLHGSKHRSIFVVVEIYYVHDYELGSARQCSAVLGSAFKPHFDNVVYAFNYLAPGG